MGQIRSDAPAPVSAGTDLRAEAHLVVMQETEGPFTRASSSLRDADLGHGTPWSRQIW